MTWVKTGEVTVSGVSSLSIDDCFIPNYTHYMLVSKGNGDAANRLLRARLRANGVDATAGDYRSQDIAAEASVLYGGRLTGQTSLLNAMGYTEAATMGFNILRISNPCQAVRTTAWNDYNYDTDGNIGIYRNVYSHDLTIAYDGITIFISTGTFTGTITVYGLSQ